MEPIEQIIVQNKNLIYSIIEKYYNNYPNKEELFQEGALAMYDASKKFDESLGFKFTTYAYPFILGAMRKHVREDRGIKVSRNLTYCCTQIEKAKIILTQKLCREPNITELSNYLDIPEQFIADALNSKREIRSIDEPFASDSKDITLHETIPDRVVDITALIALREEMKNLTEFDRQLLMNRYYQDHTQVETAEAMGITQVQVSRQEKKVLIKLRDKLAS